MSTDKRKYPRRPLVLDIELRYPSGETLIVQSRDISEGGLFLVMGEHPLPVLGELVHVELMEGSPQQEALPSSEAIVVHHGGGGMGIAFIEMERDDEN